MCLFCLSYGMGSLSTALSVKPERKSNIQGKMMVQAGRVKYPGAVVFHAF